MTKNPYVVGEEYIIPAWWLKGEPCRVKIHSTHDANPEKQTKMSILVLPLEGNPHSRFIVLQDDGTIK
jgi:hypothetical protein